MANERDEEQEPKVRIIDRRMLSDEERTGKAPASTRAEESAAPQGEAPKLEIVGGGAKSQSNPNETQGAPDGDEPGDEPMLDPQNPAPMGDPEGDEMPPMTAEEMAQMEAEMQAAEAEQFAALEERLRRPLTETEKNSVREEMARQAQAALSLDVGPVLQQFLAEMSARAAVHMGLMPNPYTRLIARNDAQARAAIESFGAIYEVVKGNLDPASEKELGRVLNDLRVNYQSITGTPLASSAPMIDKPRIIH